MSAPITPEEVRDVQNFVNEVLALGQKPYASEADRAEAGERLATQAPAIVAIVKAHPEKNWNASGVGRLELVDYDREILWSDMDGCSVSLRHRIQAFFREGAQ